MTAREAVFEPGHLLAGKYRVEALLGRGGMGAVYLATNTSIDAPVAIKVLRPGSADDERLLARFRQEAKTAAAIKHPGIVEIFDLTETEEGAPFIVMEHLEGETLGERIDRGRIDDVAAIAKLADGILAALGAAHEADILHRDLKPDNVFLVDNDLEQPKILDFGLSKLRETEAVDMSTTGELLGTPAYMSPEQARGTKNHDDTIDLYAVGGILYCALVGKPPFQGTTYAAVLSCVLTEKPPALAKARPELPPALCQLVHSLLEKDPADRPASCAQVRERLRQALPSAELPTLVDRPKAPGKKKRRQDIANDPTLHSDATAQTLHSDATGPTLHSDATGPTLHSDATKPPKKGNGTVWLIAVAALGVAALGLFMIGNRSGGGSGDKPTNATANKPDKNPDAGSSAPGKRSVLRIGIQNAPGPFDPYAVVGTPAELMLDHVIERLVTLAPDGRPLPGPLKAWPQSEGGRNVTLQLQPGLRFHDHPCFANGKGKLVSAADVIFSLELSVRKESFQLPIVGIKAFRAKKATTISGIQVKNDRVVLRLDHASPFIGMWLSIVRLVPGELASCKLDGVSNMKQPVGTGLFRFSKPVDHSHLVIERNPKHWSGRGRKPGVGAISFTLVPSPQEAITRLRQKHLDLIMIAPGRSAGVIDETQPLQPKLSKRYAAVPAVVGALTNNNYTQVLAIIRYVRKPGPLHNENVARAIAVGIDRAALVAGDKRGLQPLSRPFSPELVGRSAVWNGFQYDAVRAQALLAKAGYPKGKGLLPILLAGKYKEQAIGKRLATQLAALGIRVRFEPVMPAELARMADKGPVQGLIASFGWHVTGTEPYPYGVGFLAIARSAGKTRPRLRKLADKIEREMDRRARLELYKKLEVAIAESLDMIPLAYPPAGSPATLLVMSKHVTGVVDAVTGRAVHPGFEFLSHAGIRPANTK